MPRFRDCRAEVLHDSGDLVWQDDEVEVRIEQGWILFCYWDERGAVVFEGAESAPGRFELKARSRPRTARLVHDAERGVLEGRWSEGDERGGLRIELGRREDPA
jgi:hypothetical protein